MLLQESKEEQLEVLSAWRTFTVRELGHFKSKFRGAGATMLGAGDKAGFSLGEGAACRVWLVARVLGGVALVVVAGRRCNCASQALRTPCTRARSVCGCQSACSWMLMAPFPLRRRFPVRRATWARWSDAALDLVCAVTGTADCSRVLHATQFMDSLKGLVVPAHLRPPAQVINWIVPTGDSGACALAPLTERALLHSSKHCANADTRHRAGRRMAQQVADALATIHEVLRHLDGRVSQLGAKDEVGCQSLSASIAPGAQGARLVCMPVVECRTWTRSRCSLSRAGLWATGWGASSGIGCG